MNMNTYIMNMNTIHVENEPYSVLETYGLIIDDSENKPKNKNKKYETQCSLTHKYQMMLYFYNP